MASKLIFPLVVLALLHGSSSATGNGKQGVTITERQRVGRGPPPEERATDPSPHQARQRSTTENVNRAYRHALVASTLNVNPLDPTGALSLVQNGVDPDLIATTPTGGREGKGYVAHLRELTEARKKQNGVAESKHTLKRAKDGTGGSK